MNALTLNQTGRIRISSIDWLRGLVMVIMALDHTRDFYHAEAWVFDPTDLTRTTAPLFFTRWITHFCAPAFVLLAGVSARITHNKKNNRDMAFFLATRGLWLLLLEFTVVRFSWVFNLYYDLVAFQVIGVLGISMLLMAVLIYLPPGVLLVAGMVTVAGHNLLDVIQLQPTDPRFLWWALLHQGGVYRFGSDGVFWIMYPVLPWLGILLTGYGVGGLFNASISAQQRQGILLRAGLALAVTFVFLRIYNGYGDPSRWQVQPTQFLTILSFLNVTKYPPSLLYIALTLCPVFLALAWLEGRPLTWGKPLVIMGRVPLFYYLMHFYLIHLSALAVYALLTGIPLAEIDFHFAKGFGGIPNGFGHSLFWVYGAWLACVLVLYRLCKWYNRYKSTRSHWWLSYL